MKLMLKDDTHEHDPEGLMFAEAINKHLPKDICTFAVQVGGWASPPSVLWLSDCHQEASV